MDIESATCECCGLEEECTQAYIAEVKSNFDGNWLCGLCSEAVRDEADKLKKPLGMDEAVKAHMTFRRKCSLNPAIQVADGMREMLRRRSSDGNKSSSSSKRMYSGRNSTFSCC